MLNNIKEPYDSWTKKTHNLLLFTDRLKSRHTLRKHLLKHLQEPVACDICGKVLMNPKCLKKHVQVHDAHAREQHKCLICNKGFRERYKLKVKFEYIYHFIS